MTKSRLLFLSLIPLFIISCSGRKDKRPTGLLIDTDAYEKIPKKARLVSREYDDLPSAVDLREYVPLTGNQGQYGTCTAWATTYCAMTMTDSIRQERVGRQVAANNVFSPLFLYRNCKPDDPMADIGMSIEEALYSLKYDGVPKRVFDETIIGIIGFEYYVHMCSSIPN